jgi:PAS domain S-box-containing protein
MKNQLKILFVEDLPSDVDLAVMELRREQILFEYITVCTREELVDAMNNFMPDLIISDYMMPTYNGLQALRDVIEINDSIPFILYTGSINEETAVECLKAGAVDYVIKEHMTRLPFAVKEALEQVRVQKAKKASELLLKESEEKLHSIFSAAPVGIGLVVSRVLMEVNDVLCKMIGYDRSELIGKSAEILYPTHDEFERVGVEKYKEIAEKGTGSIETIFKCKNGKLLNVILSSTPLDQKDYLKGVTFICLDITSRKNTEIALRESEERFRSLYNDAVIGLYRTTPAGEILLANKALVNMIGYQSFDELASINLNSKGFGTPSQRQKFVNEIEKEGEIRDAEDIWFSKEGKEINIRESAKAIYDSEGKILYYDGTVEDITDRRKTEKALKESEAELRKLSLAVEQNPASVVITNTDGIIEYINPKFCEVTGYLKEELIGGNPNILSTQEKSKEEYKILWDTIKAGFEWKGEFHNKKKSGEFYWESATITPIKNDKDEITHFLGIKEDITQRKLLEDKTVASEKRYRELFLNNPIPTFIFDIESLAIVEVNDAMVLTYGYSWEEFATMTLKDIRLPEDVPSLYESVERLGKLPYYVTIMRHCRKGGTSFPVEITSHILPVKNGRITRLTTATDITTRLYAVEQMKLAKEKAEAGDRLKTTFLNNISHEVRTPLNGILGFAELLTQPDLSDEEKSDSLAMLRQGSARLLNTITNYVDVSLLTSGNMSVNKKDFIPGNLLRSVFDPFFVKCADKKLALSVKVPEDSEKLVINSDPEIFQKVISQLLNNAINFTEKGSITYGYKIKEDCLEFFVKDTGIGIDKDSVNNIFNHFIKEERDPSKPSEGSGLGLSIAKGMVEIIGGNLWVESEINVGSAFYFTVPYIKEKEKTLFIRSVMENEKIKSEAIILVAEDDDANFYYINAVLTRETGAKVLHAANGKEAIELFKANPGIVLILMDIKMPVVDGFEATRQIKLLNRNVPVIALTAYAMLGDERRVYDAGCDGYLSKPISRKTMMDKIGEFVNIR